MYISVYACMHVCMCTYVCTCVSVCTLHVPVIHVIPTCICECVCMCTCKGMGLGSAELLQFGCLKGRSKCGTGSVGDEGEKKLGYSLCPLRSPQALTTPHPSGSSQRNTSALQPQGPRLGGEGWGQECSPTLPTSAQDMGSHGELGTALSLPHGRVGSWGGGQG